MPLLEKLVEYINKKYPVLFTDKMPVWMTIFFSIAAGAAASLGTYYLAPTINQKYQETQVREAHISDATKNLNDGIIKLSQNIRHLSESLAEGNATEVSKNRSECLDLVTNLQWQLVELDVLLNSEEGNARTALLKKSITTLASAIRNSTNYDDTKNIVSSMAIVSRHTTDVLDELYKAAKLK